METSQQEILIKKKKFKEVKEASWRCYGADLQGWAVQTRDGERQKAPRRAYVGGKKMA